ncbi:MULTISPECIES: glutathione S-transferase family protein [unclassified Ruegeria]|uniref:glutathione S-transferase family protein n=1 Tax=unclassified Ruegeria TaxID=2625375 RepID=UPI001488BC22|nr:MULTISPECIES: glutathione S-transferase family protein [unclassified Ruegeria]
MFTLYWEYLAGSIVVQSVLEEIGAEYRLIYVDMGADAHRTPDFLRLNPTGRIPALGYADGKTIGETAAIVTLLGEMYPKSGITPVPGDDNRGEILFWLNVMTTSGYMTAARLGHPERYAESSKAIEEVGAKAAVDYDAFFDVMEDAIAGDPYFMTRGLTALDFYVTMLTEWHANKQSLFGSRPKLSALCESVNESRSYKAAMQTHALPQTRIFKRSAKICTLD